jgi:hypothetical protein
LRRAHIGQTGSKALAGNRTPSFVPFVRSTRGLAKGLRRIAALWLRRMRSGRRLILRIAITKAANPAHIVEALLECREATIGSTAAARGIVGAPRIILGFGTRCGGNANANYQYGE